MQDELRPLVQAVVDCHPELSELAPDNRVRYTDTVLGIIFYQHSLFVHHASRCGTIRLL
ncbi:unnamed protein product [Ascophyllum nodosum]